MPVPKIKRYLEQNKIKYKVIPHSSTSTAQEAAEAAHISGKHVAKTVVMRVNDTYALAVIPAPDVVDVEELQDALGTHNVEVASESEFAHIFQDCQTSALPPFGNLYGMEVFVSPRLRENERIAVAAGYDDELIEMSYSDFERLVGAVELEF